MTNMFISHMKAKYPLSSILTQPDPAYPDLTLFCFRELSLDRPEKRLSFSGHFLQFFSQNRLKNILEEILGGDQNLRRGMGL